MGHDVAALGDFRSIALKITNEREHFSRQLRDKIDG